MKRRLTQLAFAAGALLTLAAASLAVRGFWKLDQFQADHAWAEPGLVVTEVVRLRTDCRDFTLTRARWPAHAGGANRPYGWRVSHAAVPPDDPRWRRPPEGSMWRRLGFSWENDRHLGLGQHADFVGVPAWFAVVTCAAWTAVFARPLWRDRRRRARLRRSLCVACGYDLCGAQHERCPECGEMVESHSHGEVSDLSKRK